MARPSSQRTRATIYDVANYAGVSISTVSLALNAPNRVAAATRQRIFDGAAALGYVPRADATARARRGIGRIGVIAAFGTYTSFYQRLTGLLAAAAHRQLDVVVYDHVSTAAMISPLLTTLPIRGMLDGLIVMNMPVEPSRRADPDLPIVLVDSEHRWFDSIVIDDTHAGVLAGEHAATLGCETFLYVGEVQQSTLYTSPSQQRLSGYRTALEARGLSLPPEHVTLVPHDIVAPMSTISALLRTVQLPCVVVAHDDVLAAATIRTATMDGLRVPEDVRVIGFDDSDVARALDMTSVRVPFEESGQRALDVLAERINDSTRPVENTRLQTSLVVRASTQ